MTQVREQLCASVNTSEFHIIHGTYNTADFTLQIRCVHELALISNYLQFI
jgi:hypothetical protein